MRRLIYCTGVLVMLVVAVLFVTGALDAPEPDPGKPAAPLDERRARLQDYPIPQRPFLRGQDGPPPSADSASSVPPDTVQVDTAQLRVHGTVKAPDAAHKWIAPFVCAFDLAREGRLVARTDVAEDGKYSLVVSGAEGHALTLELAARAPGALPSFRQVAAQLPGEIGIDFDLDQGMAIRGRVVSAQGKPVPNIELFFYSAKVRGMVARVGAVFDTMSADGLLSGSEVAYHEARCVTDAGGYFSAEGLAAGDYTPWTTSTSWFIRQHRRIPAGLDTVELVADPAVGFEVFVQDHSSGKPVPSFRGTALIRTPRESINMSLTGTNGHETFVWKEFGGESQTGFDVEFRITADGYAPATQRIRFDPGETFMTTTVPMVAIPLGTAEVVIIGSVGETVDLELVADLESYPDRDASLRGVELKPTGRSGRYRIEGPAGSWMGTIHPKHELGRLLGVPVEMRLEVDTDSVARVVFPPFGHLAIKREANTKPPISVSAIVRPADQSGPAIVFLLEHGEHTFRGIPVGAWSLGIVGGTQPMKGEDFEIRAGATTRLQVGEP